MTVKTHKATMTAFVSIPASHADASDTKFCAKQNTAVTRMMSMNGLAEASLFCSLSPTNWQLVDQPCENLYLTLFQQHSLASPALLTT
jgi:hypothetical protein